MAYYNIMIIAALQNGQEQLFNAMQKQLVGDQVSLATHL
jgi:hypothetical protein